MAFNGDNACSKNFCAVEAFAADMMPASRAVPMTSPFAALPDRIASSVEGSILTDPSSTAVRAGVPSAVVPHLGDQGYWGRRIAELGLGPRPVPRARLTTRRLAGLLRTLTGPEAPRMRARALATAAELRTDGVSVAADALLR